MSGHNITVVGTGYVGMSMAALLGQHNEVTALDIDSARVALINQGQSTVADEDIQEFLNNRDLSISATMDKKEAYAEAEFIIIATPTDYDPETNYFDTSSVETAIDDAMALTETAAIIIIKSTVPVGFTASMKDKYDTARIVFSPEFCEKAKPLEIIYIPRALLWEVILITHRHLPTFCNRPQKSRISKRCSCAQLRQRR